MVDTKTENLETKESKDEKIRQDKFADTERDEGTLAKTDDLNADPSLADEDQPTWQPPESIPEPRPATR
ncbi:MAG: hypothetical protein HC883_02195 [Bdellovibrionaceae bacterium]|nr:hypothetical protein [Pseudobdellovibrionaceae bacterium]